MEINKILKELDEDQYKAVVAPCRIPICVRANAGSGKTRVLSSRVAYLVHKGATGIILLTFTNKAAKEMIERVNKIVGKDSNTKIISGTFHSIACRFLRKYSKVIDMDNNFTVLSQSDTSSIMKKVRKNVLDSISKTDIPNKFLTSGQILSAYSFYRNTVTGISFEDYLKERYKNNISIFRELISKMIIEYENFKAESNSMDFDDLIINFRKLLINKPKLCEGISEEYPYILCDEFQDVNSIQKDIVDLLDIKNCQYVVGDENQSIYGWRGSNIQYILDFKKSHKNALIINLRFNYRSGQGIVKLAENAINNNFKDEDKKVMIPKLKHNVTPIIKGFTTDYQQAEKIVDKILNEKYNLLETAILTRNNFVMRTLEFEFKKRKVPYKLVGAMPFYEKAHIKDLLSFLIFDDNNKNQIAFSRFITMANSVGPKTGLKIYNQIRDINFDYDQAVSLKFSAKAKPSIIKIINTLKQMKLTKLPSEKLKIVYNNFYKEYLEEYSEDEKQEINRKKDIRFLINSSNGYNSSAKFIEDLILDNNKDDEKDKDAVTISTVHAAKGLEWENVFLPYMNDQIFPSSKCITKKEKEEELRLFYVAITRAKLNLIVSYINAFEEDPYENISSSSPFIKLLDKKLFIAK